MAHVGRVDQCNSCGVQAGRIVRDMAATTSHHPLPKQTWMPNNTQTEKGAYQLSCLLVGRIVNF